MAATTSQSRRLLTRREAAQILGLKSHLTLAQWAHHGKNDLPVVKIGNTVRYDIHDLEQWIEARKVNNTK